MTTPQTISTERLLLRPLRESDAGPMSLYASDLRLARMTRTIPHPYPPGAAEAYIATTRTGRRGELVWAIDATPIEGPEMVGVIVYRPEKDEIGYWVGQPFWNTGYASEALEAVIAHVFGALGKDRLMASVFEDNPASIHVLEKAGFRDAGEDEGYSVARGAMAPQRLLELDRAAWEAVRAGAEAHG